MTDESNSENQARAQLASVVELVEALGVALDTDDEVGIEDATRYVHENALSVEYRSAWQSVGAKLEADEYRLLLCTGGPAVQIIGQLDEDGVPCTAEIQHQDWGTPWMRLRGVSLTEESELLIYAQQFYFGD